MHFIVREKLEKVANEIYRIIKSNLINNIDEHFDVLEIEDGCCIIAESTRGITHNCFIEVKIKEKGKNTSLVELDTCKHLDEIVDEIERAFE